MMMMMMMIPSKAIYEPFSEHLTFPFSTENFPRYEQLNFCDLCTLTSFARSWPLTHFSTSLTEGYHQSSRQKSVFQAPCAHFSHTQTDTCTPYTVKRQGHHHNGDQAVRWPHILCSICVQSFGVLVKAVQLLMASLHSLLMCFQVCRLDISVVSKCLAAIWKGDFSTPKFFWYRETWGSGIGSFVSPPMDFYWLLIGATHTTP